MENLRRQGYSYFDISKRAGVSRNRIWKLLRHFDGEIEERPRGSRLTVKDMITRYERGQNISRIARIALVSETTVSKHLRKKGIKIDQAPLRKSRLGRDEIIKMAADGKTPGQIADEAELHPATIRYHLRKNL